MHKILIATTNAGKFREIITELQDLPFTFCNLNDLRLDKVIVEEPYATTWENALHKARFFAVKTKLLTVSEDTGIFITALNGQPGVQAKRFAATPQERIGKIIEQLQDVPTAKRSAYFETSACIYDPNRHSFAVFKGRTDGRIAAAAAPIKNMSLEYDAIFYFPPLKKRFTELSLLDKNRISHRGNVVSQIKNFLMRHYSSQHIIVPVGMLIRNGKFLMTKRRDLRPEMNGKWEFPGGGVETGESFEACLKREIKEETGYSIRIHEQLPDILTMSVTREDYQVHLVIYICSITGGMFKTADAETLGHGWFKYREALKLPLLPLNKKCIQTKRNRDVLKKYIQL